MSHLATISARRLVFSGKQQVSLEEFGVGAPSGNKVRVTTCLSMMSTGTENIVFNRLFDPGTHWDNWVKYPFHPGYINVGVIDQVGEDVKRLKVGDRVAYRFGHCSHALLDEATCYPIPAEVSFEHAIWFPLAKIAYHGALAAQYRIGDCVLIIGAGPIGQMSLRWAKVAGAASILVADMAASRMAMSLAGGATATINSPIEEARADILAKTGGQLPRVVIDSTGNANVFAAALGIAADRGTVVILGDTGQPAKQTLTTDVITRGLTIVGAHDNHNTSEWNNTTIAQLFFTLVAGGRFSLDGLNSHRFVPEECAEAYATANRDRSSTMGIVFDWSGD